MLLNLIRNIFLYSRHEMQDYIGIGLLAILFFTGCYNREQISQLDEAEALLQN